MILTRGRGARWILAAAALLMLWVSWGPEALAHRRPWRHIHRRPILVLSQPTRVRQVVYINGHPHGTLDFAVDPKTTQVYVDGKLLGTVDDFDGRPQKLHLVAGMHNIVLRTPDGQRASRVVDIRAGVEINVKLDFGRRAGTD
ncbi:MAG: hypothetical protein V3U98_01220 [Acidobacteriota bacterium]